MTPKLKALHEQVGALKKEIRTYLDSDARKAVTDRDNDPKLKELEAKYATQSADLDAEFRQAARESGAPVSLTTNEARDVDSFSLGRALRASANIGGEKLDGIEGELCQEGAKEARAAGIPSFSGIMIPRSVCRRRALDDGETRRERRDVTATGTTSVTGDQGGQTIATTPMGLLDAFYNKDVLESLGITTYDGLTGNITLPRFVRPAAATHKSENAALDEISPTVASLALSPNRMGAFIDISDQLLLQSNVNIRQAIDKGLLREIRSAMQIALLHGLGSGNQPTGVAATTGIGAFYAGAAATNGTNANGAAPVWGDVVNAETAVANANADEGSLAYLMNSRMRGKLKQTLRAATSDSMMIWDDRAGGLVNSYRPVVTNAVSNTLTKGASSGILSAMFFGNWVDLVRAIWGGVNLELVTDGTLATTGLRRLVGSIYYSGGVQRPASFSYGADFITT